MRRSYLFCLITSVAMVLFAAISASAQNAQLRGHVVIKQTDGTKVPAANAVIDCYRTDLPGKFPNKANKKGEFVYAGLPVVGTYTLAVSAPNAAPKMQADIKAGRDVDYEIVMDPGDGHSFTEDEVKAANARSGVSSPGESAADRAKREEANKKYEAEKNRVTNINETLNRTFKAGKDAIAAKNYDEAVKQFDEGLAADPEQVVFYSLKSEALRKRGVDHYNIAVKATDAAVKATEMENAKKDFQASAETANKGVAVVKAEAAPADATAQTQQSLRKLEIYINRSESMRLYVKTDPTQADAAVAAYQEYMAIETDATKKAAAQKNLAQILFDSASDAAGFEKAKAEFEKILEANPEDTDALLRIGQALFNIGAMNNNDKAKYQEAANYLQRFIDKSADTNPLKAEAKDLIEALKAQANVTPEKMAPPRRGNRRP